MWTKVENSLFDKTNDREAHKEIYFSSKVRENRERKSNDMQRAKTKQGVELIDNFAKVDCYQGWLYSSLCVILNVILYVILNVILYVILYVISYDIL